MATIVAYGNRDKMKVEQIEDATLNRSALMPKCHCQGLDEGALCEQMVRSPCDKTLFDPRGPGELIL